MRPEQVDAMLKSYRACAARCAYIDAIIPVKHQQIERLRENIIADSVHITQTITDMPRGGGISDPTATLAVKVAGGYETPELLAARNEVKVLEAERAEKSLTVVLVPAWLEALNDRQRFVVRRHVIDGAYWRDVLKDFQGEFGEAYSLQGLKRIQAKALEKIYEVAE